jgi:GAF domain-containing protein
MLPEVRQAVLAERPVIARGQRPWFYQRETGALGQTDLLTDPTAATALVTPIQYQDHTVGAIGVRDPEGVRTWSQTDIEMVQAISEQFALAAENLRLIENTQKRESLERITREVTEEIRAAVSVEDAVQRTLRGLADALGGTSWVARFADRDLDDGVGHE